MAILWAGSEVEALRPGSAFSNNTITSNRDTNFTRAALSLGVSGLGFVNSRPLGNIPEAWFHYRWGAASIQSDGANRTVIVFQDSSGQGILRLYQLTSTAPNKQLQYWNGSAWVDIGSPLTISIINGRTIDMCCKIDSTNGRFALFVDGEISAELTGNTDFFSALIDDVRIQSWGSTNERVVSELIISTTSTLSMRLATISPNANGSNTAWSGVYTDISGSALNDSTMISSSVDDQYETNAMSDLSSAAAALAPVALISSARARNSPTGPQNIQHVVRTGGEEFESANMDGLTTSFQSGHQAIWELNPDTGELWTPAEINGVEIGVRSVT